MTARPGPARVLNRAELAAFHGVSLPIVDSWVAHGCPAVERGGRGKSYRFDSAAVIAWRLQEARSDAVAGLVTSSGDMAREEADRRRAVASMRLQEIEVDAACRSVVRVGDVNEDLGAFCQALRVALGNAANKIAGRASSITSAVEIEDLCHAELNRAFNSAKVALAGKWANSA